MTYTTRFLSFILLNLLLFMILTTAQSPFYMYSVCENSTQKILNASYQSNVNNFLSWTTSDSAKQTVSNHNTIVSNNNNDHDTVYGFYDCRGDITGSFCQFCINTVVRDIAKYCPNSVSAMIWYDLCIMGYTNQNPSGRVIVTPSWNVTGSKIVKDSTELAKSENNMMSLIRKVTTEGNPNWAMGEFNWSDTEKRYGMVQCNRDLSKDGCRQCLEAMLDRVPQCCGTKVGWVVVSPSCGMKIDDYNFYGQQTGSPSPLPNPGKQEGSSKTKTLIIILVTVPLAVALLSCCVYYCWRKNGLGKGNYNKTTTPIAFRDNVQEEELLNADLPTIPLTVIQQATNNFSESSKLGEGGFGPVYKGTLPNGTEVAVKRHAEMSGQGLEEFKNEVIFIAKLGKEQSREKKDKDTSSYPGSFHNTEVVQSPLHFQGDFTIITKITTAQYFLSMRLHKKCSSTQARVFQCSSTKQETSNAQARRQETSNQTKIQRIEFELNT
ncbi:salt stress response/antifungal domain protein [Medicago truncatula]|uniref:Salt stress response/antifungal domain protein n=1 Tax=Medicago truncatula TaxID=3880 RepID=G7LJ38_MEDTR|nr:salt stress response/antifungal domain protein [Medicago truncatula]